MVPEIQFITIPSFDYDAKQQDQQAAPVLATIQGLMMKHLNCTDHEACFLGASLNISAVQLYCEALGQQKGLRDRCCGAQIRVDETDQRVLNTIMNVYLMGFFGMVGVFSNFLAAIVLSHHRIAATTTSHYLLFLAISDFTLCFVVTFFCMADFGGIMPDQVIRYYIRAIPYVSVLPHISRLISILLVIAVTVERYIAVCHPLKAARFCTLQNCRLLISAIFIIAIVFNIPRLLFLEHAMCFGSDTNILTDFFMSPFTKIIYNVIFEALIYCICPFAILIVFNILLLRSVRNSTKFIRTSKSVYERRSEDNQRQLTIMLVVVVAAFVTGQVPAVIYAVVVRPLVLNDPTMYNNEVVITIDQIRNFPVILNSALNFWFYCASGKKFREILIIMFCSRFKLSILDINRRRSPSYVDRRTSNTITSTYQTNNNLRRLNKEANCSKVALNNDDLTAVKSENNNYLKSSQMQPSIFDEDGMATVTTKINNSEETGRLLEIVSNVNL